MDSFLLQGLNQNRIFTRYRIQGNDTSKLATMQFNSGFYFVGKNASSIEKLVRIFRKGYVSEGFGNAKAELTRGLLSKKNEIPEIIICESHFELSEIQNFIQFLSSHPVLKSTPVVLDGSNLTASEWQFHKKAKLVDEIILLQRLDDQTILQKCSFLNKVKAKSADAENSINQEEAKISLINFKYILKRLSDIILSIFFLFLLTPVFLLIALAISLESNGPIFYVSKRAGMGYRVFNFFKFRTMQINADKFMGEYAHLNQYHVNQGGGPLFIKIHNDPRITKVGAFLRNSGLDELPQLINVLLGDMSLVGNRPLPLYEAETLTTDMNAQRFLAPAGITGLWQIRKKGREYMSAEERIKLDIDYANKYNFMYDLWIMVNTLEYPVNSTAEYRDKMSSLS